MKPCDFCYGWFAICLHQAEYSICWKGLKDVKYIMKKQQWRFFSNENKLCHISYWIWYSNKYVSLYINVFLCILFVHFSFEAVLCFIRKSQLDTKDYIGLGFGLAIIIVVVGWLTKKDVLVYMEEMHFIARGLWLVSRKIV